MTVMLSTVKMQIPSSYSSSVHCLVQLYINILLPNLPGLHRDILVCVVLMKGSFITATNLLSFVQKHVISPHSEAD